MPFSFGNGAVESAHRVLTSDLTICRGLWTGIRVSVEKSCGEAGAQDVQRNGDSRIRWPVGPKNHKTTYPELTPL